MPAVGPDPTAAGGVRSPDYQNPQAVRYATYMLQQMVRRGLIKSVQDAAQHFGGDVTATWRALSRLTGPQMPGGMAAPPQAQAPAPPGVGTGNYGYDTGGPLTVTQNPPPQRFGRERVANIPPVARRSVQPFGTPGAGPVRQQQALIGALREIAPHLIALGHTQGQLTEQQRNPQSFIENLGSQAMGQIGQSLLNRQQLPRGQAGPQKVQQSKLRHLVEYHF